jgi:hypothetical protein
MFAKTHQFTVAKGKGPGVLAAVRDVNLSLLVLVLIILPTSGVSVFA